MNKRLVAYLAGKITDKDPERKWLNCALGTRVGYALMRAGFAVIIPHANDFPLHDITAHIEYETLMECDFSLILKCDLVLFLPNWKDSPGAKRERQFCIDNRIPFIDLGGI